jgi:hypothetical protein
VFFRNQNDVVAASKSAATAQLTRGGNMPAKKRSSKKSSSKKGPSIDVQGAIPKIKMDFSLDDKKVAAIQRCLAKGQLSIQVSRVDISAGRLGEAWEYD